MQDHRANQAAQSAHLTDAQFTDLLLGTNPSAVRAHLDVCPQCAKEADQVSSAIAGFEQQSRLWAERRAASSTVLVPHRQPVFEWLHRPQAWTAAALAIALATGIGLSVRHNRAPEVQQAVASARPAAQPSPATLKADNDLLSAINGELRADDSVSASVYGLTTSSQVTRKAQKRIAD